MIDGIYKALDICDKLGFFYGQRAGRELWSKKPANVQNEDLINFTRDIEYLKDFIRHQQVKIERLRKYDEERDIRFHARLTETARAEAIKEFADVFEAELSPTISVLFNIGEIIVDVSKCHISAESAIDKIRNVLSGAICSMSKLEQLKDNLVKETEKK